MSRLVKKGNMETPFKIKQETKVLLQTDDENYSVELPALKNNNHNNSTTVFPVAFHKEHDGK